jgi:hypothetical protein
MSLFQTILGDITKKLSRIEGGKDEIARIVTTIVGVSISANQLHIKNGTLFISVSPTVKSAIRFKQTALLSELKSYNIKIIA